MTQPTSTFEERQAKVVRPIDYVQAWRHIGEFLTNSAGAKDMAVDGSGGNPQVFSYTPPANYDAIINRLMLFLQTDSAMVPAQFGNLGAALGHGVEIKVQSVLLATWQENIDIWIEFFDADTAANISNVAADTTLIGRWTFSRDLNGCGIVLPNGETIEAIINDDLSGLTEFRMRVKGKLVPADGR